MSRCGSPPSITCCFVVKVALKYVPLAFFRLYSPLPYFFNALEKLMKYSLIPRRNHNSSEKKFSIFLLSAPARSIFLLDYHLCQSYICNLQCTDLLLLCNVEKPSSRLNWEDLITSFLQSSTDIKLLEINLYLRIWGLTK